MSFLGKNGPESAPILGGGPTVKSDRSLTVVFFACAVGFLWLSTVPATSGLVAQIFGTRYMAMLYGVVYMSHQFGSFTGVWLGGSIFDATGNYDPIWWGAVALGVVSALLHLPINDQPVSRLSRIS